MQTVALVPAKELASSLAVSLSTVWRLVRDGMPSHKLGKSRRFDRQAVMAWLDERQRKAAPTHGAD